MNYPEIRAQLYSMARKHDRWSLPIYTGIITSILSVYMSRPNFYGKDCVRVFEEFLATGNLNFA